MKIYLRRTTPVLSRREAKFAARYMSSLIMSKQLLKNIILHIEFIDNEIDPDSKNKLHGDCGWLDNNASPREFEIRINNTLNKKKTLLALGHELVHVKQYALNEMRDVFRGPTNVKWKREFVDEEKVNYFDLPWEIEAYGREVGLYCRYTDYVKKEKIVF